MTKIQNCTLQFEKNTDFLVTSKQAGDFFKLLCLFEKTGTLCIRSTLRKNRFALIPFALTVILTNLKHFLFKLLRTSYVAAV